MSAAGRGPKAVHPGMDEAVEREQALRASERRVTIIRRIIWIAVAALLVLYAVRTHGVPRSGYYLFGGGLWYRSGGEWYLYDGGWAKADAPEELDKNFRDYFGDSAYSDEFGAEEFRESPRGSGEAPSGGSG